MKNTQKFYRSALIHYKTEELTRFVISVEVNDLVFGQRPSQVSEKEYSEISSLDLLLNLAEETLEI